MTKTLCIILALLLSMASIVGIGVCLWHWWTPWAAGIFWGLWGCVLSQALYNGTQKGG